MSDERLARLLENTAAISAVIHGNEEKYSDFYSRFSNELSGFSGIWVYCAEMGEAFTIAEDEVDPAHNYIEAITSFAESILSVDELPIGRDAIRLAIKTINGVENA